MVADVAIRHQLQKNICLMQLGGVPGHVQHQPCLFTGPSLSPREVHAARSTRSWTSWPESWVARRNGMPIAATGNAVHGLSIQMQSCTAHQVALVVRMWLTAESCCHEACRLPAASTKAYNTWALRIEGPVCSAESSSKQAAPLTGNMSGREQAPSSLWLQLLLAEAEPAASLTSFMCPAGPTEDTPAFGVMGRS